MTKLKPSSLATPTDPSSKASSSSGFSSNRSPFSKLPFDGKPPYKPQAHLHEISASDCFLAHTYDLDPHPSKCKMSHLTLLTILPLLLRRLIHVLLTRQNQATKEKFYPVTCTESCQNHQHGLQTTIIYSIMLHSIKLPPVTASPLLIVVLMVALQVMMFASCFAQTALLRSKASSSTGFSSNRSPFSKLPFDGKPPYKP